MKLYRLLANLLVLTLVVTPVSVLAETATVPQESTVQNNQLPLPSEWEQIGHLTMGVIDSRVNETLNTTISAKLDPLISDKMKTELVPVNDRITAVATQNATDVAALMKRIDELQSMLQTLTEQNKTDMATMAKRVDDLQSKVQTLTDQNKADMTALVNRIDEVQSKLQSLTDQNKTDVASLNKRIDDQQGKLQAIMDKSTKQDQEVAKLSATTAGQNTRLWISMVGSVVAIAVAVLVK